MQLYTFWVLAEEMLVINLYELNSEYVKHTQSGNEERRFYKLVKWVFLFYIWNENANDKKSVTEFSVVIDHASVVWLLFWFDRTFIFILSSYY